MARRHADGRISECANEGFERSLRRTRSGIDVHNDLAT